MEANSYNLYSIILSAITLVVTVGGLYGALIQIRKIREAAWSNMHSKLCDQSFELLKFLSEYPSAYDYFYHRRQLQVNDPERVMVLCIAEALANFLEHLLLQKDQLPPEQWAVWRRFIYSTFDVSTVVCQFITEHQDWYSPDLVAIASECERAKQQEKIEEA